MESFSSGLSGATLSTAITAQSQSLVLSSVPTGLSAGTYSFKIDSELMLGDYPGEGRTFTIPSSSRGLEGTTAAAHRAGVVVHNSITGRALNQFARSVEQASTAQFSHEEFVPATGGVNVSLAHVASVVLMVSRNGLVQSADAGHYTVSGSTIAFSSAFSASERVVVAYSRGQDAPIGAQVWVLPPRGRARLSDYSFAHVHQNTA